jgi:hypothetical protein
MDDIPFADRRRNPARKKSVDLAYQVIWNPTRKGFDIHRGGVPTGSFAHDREAAIGLAVQSAQAEARPDRRVAVYSHLEGRQRAEWTSWSGAN